VPAGLLAGVPRTALAIAVVGAAATVAGRIVTDALLGPGASPFAGRALAGLFAGVVGTAATLAVMLAGLAVTDGADLRAVLVRGGAGSRT
jgi:hypothetical protein